MDSQTILHVFEAISAAFAISFAAFGAAIGQGLAISKIAESIARQPEASKDLNFVLLLGLAMLESLAIYAFLISIVLLFIKW